MLCYLTLFVHVPKEVYWVDKEASMHGANRMHQGLSCAQVEPSPAPTAGARAGTHLWACLLVLRLMFHYC